MIIRGFDATRFLELEHTNQFFKKEISEKVVGREILFTVYSSGTFCAYTIFSYDLFIYDILFSFTFLKRSLFLFCNLSLFQFISVFISVIPFCFFIFYFRFSFCKRED